MKEKSPKQVFAIRVSENMLNDIKVIAEKEDRSVGYIIRRAISRELKVQEQVD